MKFSTFFGNGKLILAAAAAFFMGTATISAEEYAEDFSTITGTATSVTALPEGWGVIGDLSVFEKETDKYHNGKPAIAINGNTENYLVTPVVNGDVYFWLRNYTKSYAASAFVYTCTEDGEGFKLGEQLGSECVIAKNQTLWTKFEFNAGTGTRLAILIKSGVIDDFYAEGLGIGEFKEKKALKAIDFALTSETTATADENNKFTASFTVTVANSGNVDLKAEEVSVSITDSEGNVLGTATATEALAVNAEATIPVTVTADAGKGGYITFYAKENIGNNYVQTTSGTNKSVWVNVTAFYPEFGILGTDGWALAEGETINFGTTQTAVSKAITVKNTGTAPLQITGITLPAGFTADATEFTVAAGGSQKVNITLTPAAEYGNVGGDVVIAYTGATFTFAVAGITIAPDLYFENFESKALPVAWENEGSWKVNSRNDNYYAEQGASEATRLITQKLTVATGESLSFEAMKAYSYSSEAMLAVYYSADRTEWTKVDEYTLTTSFQTFTVSGIAAGEYYFAFEGKNVAIDNVCGFHVAEGAPIMAIFNAEGQAVGDGAAYDFGTVTEDATVAYTLKNIGTGTLNLVLAVTSNPKNQFILDKDEVSLSAGEETTVTVTMPAEPFGKKAGKLTITDESLKTITITLAGVTRDPSVLCVDFQDKNWPKGWMAEAGWSITGENYSSTDFYAEHVSYKAEISAFISQKVKVEEGQTLAFDAKKYNDTYESSLVVYTSADRQTWKKATDFTAELTTEWNTVELTGIAAGEYYLKFEGANVCIDNIEGFAPVADDHIVNLLATVPATSVVNNQYKATATVTNLWAESEEVTVKFFLGGEEKAAETYTLALNEAQTMEFAYTPHARALDVEAYFEISFAGKTIKSNVEKFDIVGESGDFLTLSGVVTSNNADKTALEGVEITLTSGEVIYTATTDAEGAYTMKVYQTGLMYSLTAQLAGYNDYSEANVFFVSADKTLDIVMIDPTVVGINSIKTAQNNGEKVFDLQGRKLSDSSRKGLYIVGGKKMVVR